MDPSYTTLLNHLHRTDLALPVAALAHHLASSLPLPTPLAATAVSAPAFLAGPFSHHKLQSLSTAFRHAALLKHSALLKESDESRFRDALFRRSAKTLLGNWVSAVVTGVQGGHPVLRLASCTGLLLALEELAKADRLEVRRTTLEDEIVVAVAEVLDTYGRGGHDWEKEFQQGDTLSLALILASQALPALDQHRLTVLPLHVLAPLLVSTISSTFQSGSFLSSAQSSILSVSTKVQLLPNSILAETLKSISSSPVTSSMAPLSKLAAIIFSLLLESRPDEGVMLLFDALQQLREMTRAISVDWSMSQLAHIKTEDDIALESKELMKSLWMTLKIILFSIVMITDTTLSTVVLVPPRSVAVRGQATPTPSALARIVLQILFNLSFVISQFGGVTSSSTQGFKELKKAFYLAIDVLVGEGGKEGEGELFVRDLCTSFEEQVFSQSQLQHTEAKKAYALASIEQLVPVLSEQCIITYVFPICFPYLSDAGHRETYESAHSVILAMLASHAQRSVSQSVVASSRHTARGQEDFVTKMIPFYAQCLIENSADGKLSTEQLRLAYSALVKSASASGNAPSETYALAWHCIELLLDTIHQSSDIESAERVHRLHLTLISTVASLPLILMIHVLEEIRKIILQTGDDERNELVDAVFDEILARVGDREKEAGIRWWYDHRPNLGSEGWRTAVVSRL